ncbi:Forkhead box protein N4 [Eumeta japonica]|uniref:Forkhead box protein N4 n=1 Tax=Eumeta variegata TaxID=151549 RepID=A0A4C1XM56_EUMVA|nr:Forkhead box protein N4 [Eumeta japonica]
MDLYITDSLQDMLDMDIKNEMATDLGSMADFSTDSLGLNFSEMPPLLDMDTDNSSTWLSNSSSFVHNLDLYGSEANAVMVNPNSVMPSTFTETPVKNIIKEESSNLMLTSAAHIEAGNASTLSSPKVEKSHLTFSPNTIKVSKIKTDPDESIIKKPLEEATKMVIYVRKDATVVKDLLQDLDNKKNKLNGHLPATNIRVRPASELMKINSKNCSIINTNQKVTQQLGTKTIISGNIHILDAQQSRTILANGNKSQATILIDNSALNNTRQIIKTTVNGTFSVENSSPSHPKYVNSLNKSIAGEFPKPAYSYSCLIAMALKNSRTGSLPVSEIYNFMCGAREICKDRTVWKSSHCLPLLGNRRCLWAMNPSKVGKMDEEVQKWSRKDPQAIKKAMVCPESLEALERGEMKYNGTVGDPEPDGDEPDDADVDPDADVEIDPEVEMDPDVEEELDDEEIIEQELSDQELEVEEVVEGTGMVGGTYRLLAAGPTSLTSYIADPDGEIDVDEVSDVEVLDQSLEEYEVDLTKPMKLEVSLSDCEENPAKKAKTSFIYQPISAPSHTSRRKTPLDIVVASDTVTNEASKGGANKEGKTFVGGWSVLPDGSSILDSQSHRRK